MHYQTLRSVSDNHLFVVCRDGEFYSLPEHVRHRGPWQGQYRGELKNLPIRYLIDIEEQGYALVRSLGADSADAATNCGSPGSRMLAR